MFADLCDEHVFNKFLSHIISSTRIVIDYIIRVNNHKLVISVSVVLRCPAFHIRM